MRHIFAHLHIPKCGGSTVLDFLRRTFGPDLGSTNGLLNDYQYTAAQVGRILDHFPNLRCLTGHKLSLDLPFDRADFNIQAVTWIRDPVDRFVSHYFYHRNHTNIVPEAKVMGLSEYAEWALKLGNQKMYINGQVRFLSGGSLDKIRSAIASGKLLLFPLSKLEESILTLCHRFPAAFRDPRFETKNVSKKDQALPKDFREFVLPFVADDLELLRLAHETPLMESSAARPRPSGRVVSLKAFDKQGLLFEISNPVESYRIEQYGGEEAFTREILAELRPTDVFYDVGASVGLVSVHAARIAAQVVCFEPDPEVRSRLVRNLSLNGFRNAQVVEWAVADKPGDATLFTDGAEGKSPSLRQTGRRQQITLRTDSIDHALRSGALPAPDVVKIDIEGAELLALKGMRELLEGSRPPRVIFIEIHPEFLPLFHASEADVTGFLAALGYEKTNSAQRSGQIHASFAKKKAAPASHFQRTVDAPRLATEPILPKPGVSGGAVAAPSASRKSQKNPFSRSLSRRDLDVLTQLSLKLGNPASDDSLLLVQDRILELESRSIGRLAGDIQDAVLRVLVARSVHGPSLSLLEIGVLFGVNAAIIFDTGRTHFQQLAMFLIDPLDGYYGAGRLDAVTKLPVTREIVDRNLTTAGVPPGAYRICQEFSNAEAAIKAASSGRYNYMFIDGDHSYEGVRGDFESYERFLISGGYLIFDNYKDGTSPGVDRFIDEVMIKHGAYREAARGWRSIVFQRT